jgi:hypothetical protein
MENENQVPSTLVNVKRVRKGTEKKGKNQDQDQLVITFGLYEDFTTGVTRNSLDELIETLLPYQGKQVNLDIRVSQKQSKSGKKFDTAFVIVKEMIPKEQTQGRATYTTKASSKQDTIRKQASKFANGVE